MIRIVHLTSVHRRDDVRIFHKECVSLSKNYDVSLVVADGKGNATVKGVRISDVGKSTGRLYRMLITTRKIYRKSIELDANIYHAHDPELLPVLLKLKRKGKKVVFDAHEDLPKQVLSKPYLKPWPAKIISRTMAWYENRVCKKLDAIVCATDSITGKFRKINRASTCVNNYPFISELKSVSSENKHRRYACYIGGFSEIRGTYQVVKSLESVRGSDTKLVLAGSCDDDDFTRKLKNLTGFEYVDFRGLLKRTELMSILESSFAGIVTFLPAPNHIESQPNKLFEYMSAEIPVIASDFPLWREIIEGLNCGICVDPKSPDAIADAINYLVDHPEKARAMGANGRKAIVDKYNWEHEEVKLMNLYNRVLPK